MKNVCRDRPKGGGGGLVREESKYNMKGVAL